MASTALSDAQWEALRRLSYEDGDRAGVTSHLAQARERASHDVALNAARERLAAADAAAKRAAAARRAQESTIEDLNLQMKRTEGRLASGKLSSEREVGAAMSEIEKLKVALGAAETAWLEASSEEDARIRAVPAAKANLGRVEPEGVARMAAAAEQAAGLETRLAEVDAARRAAAQSIPAEVRDRYRVLFQRMAGRPFAHVAAGQCSNCSHSLPAAAVQMTRSHSGVPNCPSCGKLLLDS